MTVRRIVLGALLVAGVWQLLSGMYIPTKALVAQWMIRDAWQRGRTTRAPVAPWSWADTAPVGRLRAPEHERDFIVLAGASGEALAFGPGHVRASAAPGSDGHTVIGGHRDTHFKFLRNVELGDRFELEGLNGRRLTYYVEQMRAVNINDEPLALMPDQSRLTLITCYPFEGYVPGGPWRYVVDAAISTSTTT